MNVMQSMNVDVDLSSMNRDITLEDVMNAASKAKLGKAVGIDQLPSETLKYGPVYPFMVNLFNYCFKYRIIPSAWQKSGDKDIRLPLNYRGITLTCHMYKIYCTILNVWLSTFLEENQILEEEQNEFRKMRSCLDHIFTLITTIENRYKRRQSTYLCFVNMKKAFDSINRTYLLHKLRNIGVNCNIYFAVKTIYENVACGVRINGIYTDWFAVDLGVKQGCILSPTLFSIYINDLAKAIKELDCGIVMENSKLNILLFADDIALIADSLQ